jgi:hypothetical protein
MADLLNQQGQYPASSEGGRYSWQATDSANAPNQHRSA